MSAAQVMFCTLFYVCGCFRDANPSGTLGSTGQEAALLRASLVGVILFDDGSVPERVGITLAPSQTDYVYPPAIAVQLSSAGKFSLPVLSRRRYDVIIAGPGFGRVVLTGRALDRTTTNLGVITVTRETVISGVVNDRAGNPIADAWVRVFRRADPRDVEFQDSDILSRLARESYLAITGPDGRFRIDGVVIPKAEFLQLSATLNGVYASGILQVNAPDKNQTLVVYPVGAVEGTVKGPWTTERYLILRGLSHSASSRTTQHVQIRRDGSFSANNLPEGDYELESVPERTVRALHIGAGAVTSVTP